MFNVLQDPHPSQACCSIDLLPSEFHAYLVKIDAHVIPKNYKEAMESKEWKGAVGEEVGAMVRNHTWDEADLPPGKKAVSSTWGVHTKVLE